jgi:hypothetical protein
MSIHGLVSKLLRGEKLRLKTGDTVTFLQCKTSGYEVLLPNGKLGMVARKNVEGVISSTGELVTK